MKNFKLSITVLLLLFVSIKSIFAQKDENLIATLKEHSDEVHSIAFSPDGKQFISGSKDETIKIWDFGTLQAIQTLQRHYATIYELEYSADGGFFFSGGDKTINIWNKDGSYVNSLSGHTTAVWSLGVSRNGKYLVSGSFDNNFRLWDIKKAETLHIFENNKKSVLAVAYSISNNLIACGSQDGSIQLYTFDNFELIHSFSAHGGNIYSLDFSNNGKYLASASRDNNVKIWDLEKMEISHVLTGHERSVMSIKYSSNDRYLLSGSYDASIILWDVQKGEEIYTFLGHSMPVNDIDISQDCKYILSASSDQTIKLWEIKPEILINYYFEDEFQNELSKSNLFDPKRSSESRAEYKERQEKAELYKQTLLQKFIDRLDKSN
ncbi:MAG: hypothetical protein C0597_01710 [Marinilabiliales bacterium]|nr:MAG: hypothetical protein C0597_01710 [Marinilabiliales bacterium]